METSVNNKCRAFTSLEQSRKLAEILPLESADMRYICIDICKELKYMPEPRFIKSVPDHADEYDVCAWSLAALLGVLPNNEHITTKISKGGWKIMPREYLPNIWWCDYKDEITCKMFETSENNPVDACYEMILKLNELNLL